MKQVSKKQTPWTFEHQKLVSFVNGRMEAQGLNLRQAALEIGIGHATLWRIQRHQPDVKTLVRVCQWLAISVDTFVGRGER